MMASPHGTPLRRLLGPGQPEVTCDVCFGELDRYVDLELSGADAEAAVPGMAAHLRGCPACGEEHDSLRALLSDATCRAPEPPAC
jgi:anti-sigma factor RsiW